LGLARENMMWNHCTHHRDAEAQRTTKNGQELIGTVTPRKIFAPL